MSKRKNRFVHKAQASSVPATFGTRSLEQILFDEQKISIEKSLTLENTLRGSNVADILKAQNYLQNMEKAEDSNGKAILVDPMKLNASFGYKDKPFNLSYDMLRAMARTHIFKAIIQTRKSQIQNYCEPVSDKYSTGFVIEKRNKWRSTQKDKQLTKAEEKKIDELTMFMLDCGNKQNFWNADTFSTFAGKIAEDSLVLDQATAEIERNMKGEPISFYATDAATFRLADTYGDKDDNRQDIEIINGYKPAYVQLIYGKVEAQFHPWELMFGVRNPQTDIYTNGYGKSELEDMVATITSLLNADAYNANFFKVGSSPQGIISYSGNINQNTLESLRTSWQAQVAGVGNAHKTPVINADKIQYIPTHVPNKDMEYAKFQEFLIKVGCAIYTIDPSEIGFPMDGASDGNGGLGGKNNSEKLKYSKDKGLKPLLKHIEHWINKYIIWQIDSEFEFRFVGVDDFEDKATDLENDIKKLGSFMTVNEIRAKHNLEALDNMDIILNPVASQANMMAAQGNEESNAAIEQDEEPNPFMKSLNSHLERLTTD